MQSCCKFLSETYLVRWRLAALSRTEVVICASQISASCPSIGQLQEMEGGGPNLTQVLDNCKKENIQLDPHWHRVCVGRRLIHNFVNK